MRINVDDSVQSGAAHRRRGRGEKRRRAGGKGARAVGLADELGTMAAAQPQQRRGAEQLEVGETCLQLLERAGRVGELRAGREDAHEMAERRVAERPTTLELTREESGHVMTGRVLHRARLGLERLHDHAARRVSAAATRELGEELERPLLGTEVGQAEPRVGVDDRGELDAGEVMAFRDHLRADEDGAVGAREPLERLAELLGLCDRVGVEPDPLELGDVLLELSLEPLRARPDPRELGRTARRTCLARPAHGRRSGGSGAFRLRAA